ncbi:hypothetical protein [Brevibacillus sp. H7]|uniref:hypothetical protein n=1 Tax=Brevibacillus sp. H7 TaxID=3349138 RepID=UPI0037F4C3D9
MTPNQHDYIHETLQRIHHRLDLFEERINKLEQQGSVAAKWLEKIELRLENEERSQPLILQAIAKLQVELEHSRLATEQLQRNLETEVQSSQDNKEIILQLLENDKSAKEHLTQLIEGEKGRKQERFLQIWAILGPVIASVLTTVFFKFLL